MTSGHDPVMSNQDWRTYDLQVDSMTEMEAKAALKQEVRMRYEETGSLPATLARAERLLERARSPVETTLEQQHREMDSLGSIGRKPRV